MKKFFVPLFLVLLFSCSNEGFKSDIAADSQKREYCKIGEYSKEISKTLCEEVGGETGFRPPSEISSSSDEDVSSSSGGTISSSSRNNTNASSSSVGALSSSSRNTSSSSSHNTASSSSGDDVSSSSDDDDVSSSSGGALSSSSNGAISSSSSVGISSSSSSLPSPSLGDCSTSFPSYVAKAPQKESLSDLVPVENNYDRCVVTYSVSSTGGGSNVASISGDEISFTTNGSSSGARTINIAARATCTGFSTPFTKTCPIQIEVIADKFAKIETCDNPRIDVGPGSTVVEITCVKESGPASHFGCDKPAGSSDFGPSNVFTLNKVKAGPNTTSWQSSWADIAIPAALAAKENKRVLIEYNGGTMGCVAY